MNDDIRVLKRSHHALNMLVMFTAGHYNLREDKFDEYFDVLTQVLELANNEKHRLVRINPRSE